MFILFFLMKSCLKLILMVIIFIDCVAWEFYLYFLHRGYFLSFELNIDYKATENKEI